MTNILITLFVANAVAHIISFAKLKQQKSSNALGVLVFAFINGIIAFCLFQGFSWSIWPALIFPLLGAFGLFVTTLSKKKGTWIDFVILALDVVSIALVVYLLLAKFGIV